MHRKIDDGPHPSKQQQQPGVGPSKHNSGGKDSCPPQHPTALGVFVATLQEFLLCPPGDTPLLADGRLRKAYVGQAQNRSAELPSLLMRSPRYMNARLKEVYIHI